MSILFIDLRDITNFSIGDILKLNAKLWQSSVYEPAYEIMVFIAYGQMSLVNAQADYSSEVSSFFVQAFIFIHYHFSPMRYVPKSRSMAYIRILPFVFTTLVHSNINLTMFMLMN